MTKPVWEEEWSTGTAKDQWTDTIWDDSTYERVPVAGGVYIGEEQIGSFGEYDYGCPSDPGVTLDVREVDSDRAKLASAAPDMARLLLKLECVDMDYMQACPLCWAELKHGEVHSGSCEWVRVMNKAGIR